MAFDAQYDGYAARTYGKIANRTIEEIMRRADRAAVKRVLGFDEHRYVNNSANRFCGYVRAERAAFATAIGFDCDEEIRFAWRVELTLAKAFAALDAVREGM